jgi:hypothetical protein
MGHGEGEGQCIRCFKCREYIRPEDFFEGKCSIITDFERSHIFDILSPQMTFYIKNGKSFTIDTKNGHQEIGKSMLKILIGYLQRIYDMEKNE